ncbi:MAG: glutamyl-tRNA amidotransferase [Saprospirales bacterium]|nr:glutamyl-tRNA amidotransferase [Saprospirales bacterium]
MSISPQIQVKLKEAMKAKDKARLTALRGIKSALQLAALDKNDGDLALSEELKVLHKLAKQRVDSMVIYKEQGRDDLFEIEASELEVIKEFLPEPMGEVELKELVTKVVSSEGANSLKDMGRVIKEVTKHAEGRAEGKRIAQEVKSQLQ